MRRQKIDDHPWGRQRALWAKARECGVWAARARGAAGRAARALATWAWALDEGHDDILGMAWSAFEDERAEHARYRGLLERARRSVA